MSSVRVLSFRFSKSAQQYLHIYQEGGRGQRKERNKRDLSFVQLCKTIQGGRLNIKLLLARDFSFLVVLYYQTRLTPNGTKWFRSWHCQCARNIIARIRA